MYINKLIMKKIILALGVLISLQACKKDKFEQFSVVYEVEFVSGWSASTHPTDFPNDAHFSPFIVTSHLASQRLFLPGFNADIGVQNLAETGNTDEINLELDRWLNTSLAVDKGKGGRFDSPGNSNKVQLGVREGYSTVTALSMIAPSPDWFVATTTNLQDPIDGLWYDEVISYVATYDAGTDSGSSFNSPDEVSDPVESVSFLDVGPLTEGTDTVINMGYFKFTRVKMG